MLISYRYHPECILLVYDMYTAWTLEGMLTYLGDVHFVIPRVGSPYAFWRDRAKLHIGFLLLMHVPYPKTRQINGQQTIPFDLFILK